MELRDQTPATTPQSERRRTVELDESEKSFSRRAFRGPDRRRNHHQRRMVDAILKDCSAGPYAFVEEESDA